MDYVNVADLPALDRQFLVERQLISRELADGRRARAASPSTSENRQPDGQRGGPPAPAGRCAAASTSTTAWQRDRPRRRPARSSKSTYAFSDEFGYLTACPTNVGTGMRASVMLHLPALVLTKQIEKVFRALQKINLAVRGLYGEGSRASGDFYQISNQVTLGKSEATDPQRDPRGHPADHRLRAPGPHSPDCARTGRACTTRSPAPTARCSSATMMTSEETMDLLSSVRLGINLGLIDDLPIPTVNELFIHTQPAHLQKLMGAPLDGEERNAARARYLRKPPADCRFNPLTRCQL